MEELMTLQSKLLQITKELVSSCPFCIAVSEDPASRAPVMCTKWSGSAHPIGVNTAACLNCGEYRRSNKST